MPYHNDPAGGRAAEPLNRLEQIFDARLYGAAERLVDAACVADLRILQGGRVLTGVCSYFVGEPHARSSADSDQHRVYIQCRSIDGSKDPPILEGECSCGGHSPCVHVAAVSIAAAKSLRAQARPRRESAPPAPLSRGPMPVGPPAPALRGPPSAEPLSVESLLAEPRPRQSRSPLSVESATLLQRPPAVEPTPLSPGSSSLRASLKQRLYYLLTGAAAQTHAVQEAQETHAAQEADQLQLSVWVAQASQDGRDGRANACPFVPRNLERQDDFPRYVDAQDREILMALMAQHVEGPWDLKGDVGSALVRQIVATGRALWHSLQGQALSQGSARQASFAWEALPDGAQQLYCATSGSLVPLLGIEPILYIDTAANECAELVPSCSVSLLRHYWSQAAIAPEEVATVSECIARHPEAHIFPRPRALPVHRRAVSTLRARLHLSADAAATLQIVYDGIAVDSRAVDSLAVDGFALYEPVVRHWDGECVHEIERDAAAEQTLRAQFGQLVAPIPRTSDAWLAFMASTVPALTILGWEIDIDPRFPYRLATTEEWYADLTTPGREWFDLRLGVTVDGERVNLLPALVDYLQATTQDAASVAATGAFGAAATGAAMTGAAMTGADGAAAALAKGAMGAVGAAGASLACSGEHLFVALKDGRYLALAKERIQRIADTLVELYDRDGLSSEHALTLPVSQAGRLAQFMLEAGAPTLRSTDAPLRRLIEELRDSSGIAPLAAPATFPATLRPYQQEGLGWLQFLRRHRLGGILADDMGLGKTVQTLAHLATEKAEGRLGKPSLIVAPVSVLGNWQQEIGRLTPGLALLIWHGATRRNWLARFATADVVITGYPLLLQDREILLAQKFYFLILDEAQTIKNTRAKVSQVARELRAEHRLCLTGTPMENHLGELWSLFDCVQPGLLGDEKQFQRHYRAPIEKAGNGRRARALKRRIAPFLLRRTKDTVARELPPKMQMVASIVLDDRQRDFYDGIRLAMNRRVREALQRRGLARSRITVLDALLRLRQACCDPRLVDAEAQSQAIPSAKLEWLSTALPEMIAAGRRILLFSQFTSMLRLIEAQVSALSIPYCLLTGDTQNRTALVQRFQSGDVPLFLISLKAGGTGLNLTAADTIVHYDPWWNPAAEAQATDRAHRIGQDKAVFVYRLIAQDTVEEKIMRLQADKNALVDQLYSDQDASPAGWGAADVEALFAP